MNEKSHLPVKAGDIFATRSRTLSSICIRIATQSQWSHVAIALDEAHVLEAVKRGDPSIDEGRFVRKLSLDGFLRDKSKVLLMERPHPLSEEEKQRLHAFSDAQRGASRYTKLHAGLSAVPTIIVAGSCAVTVYASYKWWTAPFHAGTFSWSLLVTGLLAGLSFGALTMYGLLFIVWSSRIQWGIKATEQLLRRCSLGTWFVEDKCQMFCSKLVALVDNVLGGQMSTEIPFPDEAQPKHIVWACKKLVWESRKL